jgi:hypothetical protein
VKLRASSDLTRMVPGLGGGAMYSGQKSGNPWLVSMSSSFIAVRRSGETKRIVEVKCDF